MSESVDKPRKYLETKEGGEMDGVLLTGEGRPPAGGSTPGERREEEGGLPGTEDETVAKRPRLDEKMTFYTDSPPPVPPRRRGGGYVYGRDPIVDEVMEEWSHKYATFKDAHFVLVTFNVNGKTAPGTLPELFPKSQKPPDLCAVGLQEMDLALSGYISDNHDKALSWIECLKRSLPGPAQYDVVATPRLVGIFLVLFRRKDSHIKLSQVVTISVPTGLSFLMNKLGNKGGVGISFLANDSRVCLINCHLAAGNNELERRNQDFREIAQLQFGTPVNLGIYDHEVVFLIGDLNYRLNVDGVMSSDELRRMASSSNFKHLIQYDQLREQQLLGKVFEGFNEPKTLDFPPTYKYDYDSCRWDTSEKARAPAWCDRVLWFRRSETTQIVQTTYASVPQIGISDHKPVHAAFMVALRTVDVSKRDKIYEAAIREGDKRANEALPQVSLSVTDVDFGVVKFLEPAVRAVKVTNTGKSALRFKFVAKSNRGEVSARWLTISPSVYTLHVNLTVLIDRTIAWDIEGTKDGGNLSDILVMNLDHGRDYFITVSAQFPLSCFGATLERLMTETRKKEEANLIDFGEDNFDASAGPGTVPKEIYRLVSAIRQRGLDSLNVSSETFDSESFIHLRNALESGIADLALTSISTYMLYQGLLRLIDSMKTVLLPDSVYIQARDTPADAARLWTAIGALSQDTVATVEFLVDFLREIVRAKPTQAQDQVVEWSNLLYRKMEPQTLAARVTSLRTLMAFHRDVSTWSLPR